MQNLKDGFMLYIGTKKKTSQALNSPIFNLKYPEIIRQQSRLFELLSYFYFVDKLDNKKGKKTRIYLSKWSKSNITTQTSKKVVV